MTGVTLRTRSQVIFRDTQECQWCGAGIVDEYSLQHRRARGMGGTSKADANQPANLVLVCGSATTGCHGQIESHRIEARYRGFNIRQGVTPTTIPLQDAHGVWWLLDDLGGRVSIPAVLAYRYLAA